MTWTLRKKILLGYGIALLLLGVVFVLSFVNLQRLGQASEAILSENYRSILAAEHMVNALERQDSGVLLYLLGDRDQGIRQFRENQADFQQWLGRAKDNITIDEEPEVLARIDSTYADYLVAFTGLVESAPASLSPSTARERYREELLPAFRPVRDASQELRELNQETMFAASRRAQDVAHRATWTLGLVGSGVLMVGLLFSLLLSNRIVRPVRELSEATRRIADGDYDVEVPAEGQDELARLAHQFNEMAEQLRSYRDLNIEQIVAERRKSDAIVRSIDDALIAVDEELRVQNVNPSARRLLGDRGREAEGRHLLEVVRSEAVFERIRETVESGRAPELEEQDRYVSVEMDGQPRHYEIVITPVIAPEGEEAHGAILMLRDVTKLKKLDRMKSEFVATASHELRTPLTSIAMSLDLLDEHASGRLEPEERTQLEGAREDVERLRSLIGDLLELSRIESGRIDLDIEAVEVSVLCDRAVEVMTPQADERSVEILCRWPDGLPRVRADANKATWVLTNLLSNAVRYTDPGGDVAIDASADGSSVRVSVTDDGPGIAYEDQSRIFDKFVQVEDGRTPEGSGLGLAICREIVRAHGGSIWVESEPGEGSVFTFTLPVAA